MVFCSETCKNSALSSEGSHNDCTGVPGSSSWLDKNEERMHKALTDLDPRGIEFRKELQQSVYDNLVDVKGRTLSDFIRYVIQMLKLFRFCSFFCCYVISSFTQCRAAEKGNPAAAYQAGIMFKQGIDMDLSTLCATAGQPGTQF